MTRNLIISALLLSATLNATEPTQAELTASLDHAVSAWGTESPYSIEMRVEDIGSCSSIRTHDVAITQVTERWSQMIGDDGKPMGERTYTYTVIVRFNSQCDWSHLNLNAVMEHEYGHILISAAYHSKDKHSIMYPIVDMGGKQQILPADREQAKKIIAEK